MIKTTILNFKAFISRLVFLPKNFRWLPSDYKTCQYCSNLKAVDENPEEGLGYWFCTKNRIICTANETSDPNKGFDMLEGITCNKWKSM